MMTHQTLISQDSLLQDLAPFRKNAIGCRASSGQSPQPTLYKRYLIVFVIHDTFSHAIKVILNILDRIVNILLIKNFKFFKFDVT